MILDLHLLPKKMNEINYFKKIRGGCEIYSYASNTTQRNEVIVVSLENSIEDDFCVDSKALDMARALSPCDITITDKSFIIKSSKGKYTSRLLNEALFDLSQSNLENEINVVFDKLLKASSYVCKNDKKPVLTGVRVDSENNIYATDSFKAYFYKPNQLSTKGITIPVNFINLVKTIFNDIKDVNIKYNNNIALIEKDNIKIYGRLIDGAYPNMEKIIPNISYSKKVNFNVDELKDRLDIASNVGSDIDKRTVLSLSENKIEALGEDNYEAQIQFENDNEFSIQLQLELLSQALKTIDKPILSVLSKDRVGQMLFVLNEEEKELILVMGIK